MAILCALLTVGLLTTCVFVPVLRHNSERRARRYVLDRRAYQIWAIKRYYPLVSDLSYEEINDQYDVTASYNNIGRSLLRFRL